MKTNISLSILAAASLLAGCTAKEGADAVTAEEAKEAVTDAVEAVAESAEATVAEAAAAAEAAVTEVADPSACAVQVNGECVMTVGELEDAVNQLSARYGGNLPPQARDQMRARLSEQKVMETVLKAEVKKNGITVNDDDRVEFVRLISNGMHTNVADIAAMMNKSVEEIAEKIDSDAAIQKLLSMQTNGVAAATEEDARKRFDEIVAQNPAVVEKPETVTASHILVKVESFDDTNAVAAARAKIDGLRKRALDGEDFGALAEEFSDCPSGKNAKGSLGEFRHGQMVPEFDKAAFEQEIGVVGEVVQTSFGFHIIKVTAKTPASKIEFAEVKDDIISGLNSENVNKAIDNYIKGLVDAAKVEFPSKAVVSEPVAAPSAEREPPAWEK